MIAIESSAITSDEVRAQTRQVLERENSTIDAFHRVFYAGPTWSLATWMGVPILKNPCDLMTLQELIYGLKPALIVETGTAYGGSALFLGHVCDMTGGGHVVSIDLEPHPLVPRHPRVTYRVGSSVDAEIVEYVTQRAARAGGPVLVLLDSDHHEPHVTAELAAYAGLVTPGSYLVVEDTNVNGRPVLPAWGPGPAEAVDAFLVAHPEFERDPLCERYLLTMHPGGWLRRIA